MSNLLIFIILSTIYAAVAATLYYIVTMWDTKYNIDHNPYAPSHYDVLMISTFLWPILPLSLTTFLITYGIFLVERKQKEEVEKKRKEREAEEMLRKEGLA